MLNMTLNGDEAIHAHKEKAILTSQMHRIWGTRGNFGFVLSVTFLAASSFVARWQGRPPKR